MNNVMCHPAESEVDIHCMTVETRGLEDLYSTTPLKIIGSMYRQSDEDELHSAFEEAISERVLAFHKQRMSISIPGIDSICSLPSIQTKVSLSGSAAHSTLLSQSTRKIILLIAIAFMLFLVGFNLMGLLVLLTSP